MRKLEITTPYGKRYYIHDNGDIDYDGLSKSGQWKLLGLTHVKRSETYRLQTLLQGVFPAEMLYKNGNPQWTVLDYDHGTKRMWGNTKYHGVQSIQLLKEQL